MCILKSDNSTLLNFSSIVMKLTCLGFKNLYHLPLACILKLISTSFKLQKANYGNYWPCFFGKILWESCLWNASSSNVYHIELKYFLSPQSWQIIRWGHNWRWWIKIETKLYTKTIQDKSYEATVKLKMTDWKISLCNTLGIVLKIITSTHSTSYF